MRNCPECTFGKLDIAKLSQGLECPHCHKIIEIDAKFSYGIPILLALIVGLSFSNDFGVIGYCGTASLVLFTAGYRTVWVKYLPIKHYKN